MSEHRGRDDDRVARDIDNFSILVLRYDRHNPRPAQRTPGEIIEEVEERITAAKARKATIRKWIGALLLSITSAILMAVLTTWWPWLVKNLGGHG